MNKTNSTNAPVAPIQPIAMSSAQELWLVDISLPTTTSATPAAVVGGITVWPAPAPLLKYIDHTKTKIRRAQRILCALDDREGWQRDLILLLEEQAGVTNSASRLEGLLAGLNVYCRFFEVRNDLSFRHQPEKFDDAGFLRLTNPWTYADNWWDSVPADALKSAEDLLVAAGILEFKEIRTPETILAVRLRSDRIIATLTARFPEKYSQILASTAPSVIEPQDAGYFLYCCQQTASRWIFHTVMNHIRQFGNRCCARLKNLVGTQKQHGNNL